MSDMPAPEHFAGFTASVSTAPDNPVLAARQAVLADHGQEVREALAQLPPELGDRLLREPASAELVSGIAQVVDQRGRVSADISHGAGLDRQWLDGAPAGAAPAVAAADEWNSPAPRGSTPA
ncbi:hypothetical protein [Tahibacter amnicola]|uniref:Uncharacterized protein n=1 Tax=Tahibacter amnicola TaxID=2976241 RepID=A0ABY6BE86_9GAMM|nr:hypothetical protein [Tahibacter amnicola]UXI68348.1 hypothetical protein N4264_01470 [Tahibacter amnicola]